MRRDSRGGDRILAQSQSEQADIRVLPLLPLRGLLVYPASVNHLDVGRERSVRALDRAMVGDNHILL
ncbi:MAG: hypothetical protein OWT27_03680, partial [Firmicutes bacterium]|nr:hypothetical protein [Bacillota bacterium]